MICRVTLRQAIQDNLERITNDNAAIVLRKDGLQLINFIPRQRFALLERDDRFRDEKYDAVC